MKLKMMAPLCFLSAFEETVTKNEAQTWMNNCRYLLYSVTGGVQEQSVDFTASLREKS